LSQVDPSLQGLQTFLTSMVAPGNAAPPAQPLVERAALIDRRNLRS
jgi:hypothetical protein